MRKRPDLVRVQRDGKARHSRYFVVVSDIAGSGRLGITVSRKVGNAVVRNRVKRVVREFVRTACAPNPAWTRSWLGEGLDVVVIAKPLAKSASTSTLWEDLASMAPDESRFHRASL